MARVYAASRAHRRLVAQTFLLQTLLVPRMYARAVINWDSARIFINHAGELRLDKLPVLRACDV